MLFTTRTHQAGQLGGAHILYLSLVSLFISVSKTNLVFMFNLLSALMLCILRMSQVSKGKNLLQARWVRRTAKEAPSMELLLATS